MLCFTRHQENHIFRTSWLDYLSLVSWHRLGWQNPVHHTQPSQHLQVPPSRAAPTPLGTSSTRTLSVLSFWDPSVSCSQSHAEVLSRYDKTWMIQNTKQTVRSTNMHFILPCARPCSRLWGYNHEQNRHKALPSRANISMGDTNNK